MDCRGHRTSACFRRVNLKQSPMIMTTHPPRADSEYLPSLLAAIGSRRSHYQVRSSQSIHYIRNRNSSALTLPSPSYQIGPSCSLSHPELNGIITHCIRHTPSMFNMQSTRIIILYDRHHRDFWDLCVASLPQSVLEARPNVAHEYYTWVSARYVDHR